MNEFKRTFALFAICVFAQAAGAQTKPKTRADTTQAAKPAKATSGPWTGSTKGKTYYRTGCSTANKLAAQNRIYFATEDDAKKAGYTRSRSKGC